MHTFPSVPWLPAIATHLPLLTVGAGAAVCSLGGRERGREMEESERVGVVE